MIGRAFRIVQILSIDIVIGAVILLRFFCAQFGVTPGWQVQVLLGGSVWLIYTSDHLRDAIKAEVGSRERYAFHRIHRRTLHIACVLVALGIAPLVLYLPLTVLYVGLGLAACSFIYLMVQHRLASVMFKEFYVAAVYSCGVMLVPMTLSNEVRLDSLFLLFLLTLVNLLMFSWNEHDQDQMDGFDSIATRISSKRLEAIILVLIAIGLSVTMVQSGLIPNYFLVSFAIYGSMIAYPNWFRRRQRYRSIGDGVFLLPILLEWF